MVAFGEQEQAACSFEIERFATPGQRTDHDSAGRRQALFGGPERVFALARADDDKSVRIKPKLSEPRRIRRAFLRKHALFTSQKHRP